MRNVRVLPLVLVLLAVSSLASAQTALGPEFQVSVQTEGDQVLPQVAMNVEGDFVVVWNSQDSPEGQYSLYARRFAADGTPVTGEILVRDNAGYSVEAAVAMMEDGSFAVVYSASSDALPGSATFTFEGRRFAADGAPLGEPFAIGTGHAAHDVSVAARPQGGFVVAWEAYRQEIPEVSVRIFDGDGSPVRNEISVAQGNDPALAVGPKGEIVVVWMAAEPGESRRRYFVALQRLSPDGALQGRRLRVSNNSELFLSAIRVAKDKNGSFWVIWGGDFGGAWRHGTLGQRFSSNGTPLARLTRLDGSQLRAEITMAPTGEFVLVWTGFEDGRDVFRRKFRAFGGRSRQAFRVNTTRPGDQEEAAVAGDGAGNFVVVWQGEEQDGSGSGIFARLYSRR